VVTVEVGFLVGSKYGKAYFSLVGLASSAKFEAEHSGRGEKLGFGR